VRKAVVEVSRNCDVWRYAGPYGETTVSAPGRLLTARNPDVPKLSRSIFIADLAQGDTEVQVRSAQVDEAGVCRATGSILAIPRAIDADLAFDANLRHLMHTAAGGPSGGRTVTLYEIDWELTDDVGGRQVRKFRKVDLTGPEPARLLGDMAQRVEGRAPGIALLDTWRETGGRVMAVGPAGWRIFSPQAQRLQQPVGTPDLESLTPAAAGGACSALAERLLPQQPPGFELAMYQAPASGPYCYAIVRGRPPDAAGSAQQIVVAVYAQPGLDAVRRPNFVPAPVASLQRFGRIGAGEPMEWFVGTRDGPLAGWVAGLGRNSAGVQRFIGAPWSTCALWRIGVEVLAQQPGQRPQDPRQGDVDKKTCRGR
jgi:hypothetical protein